MVDVSAQSGLDLGNSRSAHVTERLIETSDIIFVMEKSHYDKLMVVDDSIGDKVFLLGAHQNNVAWPAEIEDPYGHARERYEACFERITGAVDNIKAVIAVNSID
jgi:protein-tyrosine-phosphatase